jgi:pimeloyl-ACP methyl ester carboxylesterase
MNGLEAGRGNKDLIIFLHGFPDTAVVWKNYVDSFSKDFHVIAPQIPEVRTDFISFQKSILDQIHELNPSRTFIVGHDLGTVWATSLADYLKDDLNGLVLINGLGLPQFKKRLKNPKQLMKSWYMFLLQIPVLPEILIEQFPSHLMKIPKKLNQESFPEKMEGLKGFWQYRSFLKEMFLPDSSRIKIVAPTLVLWGSRDAFLEPPKTDEFLDYFSKFEIRIFKGDHWFHLSQEQQVFDTLNNFIGVS